MSLIPDELDTKRCNEHCKLSDFSLVEKPNICLSCKHMQSATLLDPNTLERKVTTVCKYRQAPTYNRKVTKSKCEHFAEGFHTCPTCGQRTC